MTIPDTDDREPSARIRVDYDDADDFIGEYDGTLASGHAFFATTTRHAVGSRLRLVLSFPGLREPVAVDAMVEGMSDAEPAGIMISLDDVSLRSLARTAERVRAGDPELVRRILKILLVEDNPHLTELMRGGLRKPAASEVDFELQSACDGREALRLLAAGRFEVAIVDVYLPVIDGAEVIRRARRELGLDAMHFIAVSAGGPSARQAALEAGATAFFDKPIRFRQIFDTVRRLCDLEGGR